MQCDAPYISGNYTHTENKFYKERVLKRVREGNSEMVICCVWRVTKDLKSTGVEKSVPCKGTRVRELGIECGQGYSAVSV